MRRLTLNMLLSFAQFEREVTAERIRDKIAASKAKGMCKGGTPPLGYAPEGRSLAIVPEHAKLIRTIARTTRRWQPLTSEPTLSTSALAGSEGITPSYLTRILRLGFLNPTTTEAIVISTAPASFTAKRLTQTGVIPICWNAQR